MIIYSIGLPGAFSTWCDKAIERLAQLSLGPTNTIKADTLDAVTVDLMRTGSPNLVVCSRRPSRLLRSALADTNSRFILAITNPLSATADLAAVPPHDLLESIRSVVNSYNATSQCRALPGALAVADAIHWASPEVTADLIARHLGISASPREISMIVRDLRSITPSNGELWRTSLDPPARALVDGALSSYVEHLATGNFGQMVWERYLFFIYAEPPTELATRMIDITGRSRILLIGPYFTVPPGQWSLHLALVCSKEVVGNSFVIDVYCGANNLVRSQFLVDRSGVVVVAVDFIIEEGRSEDLIEVRIINDKAMFDGRIGLGRAILLPRQMPHSEEFGNIMEELGLEIA